MEFLFLHQRVGLSRILLESGRRRRPLIRMTRLTTRTRGKKHRRKRMEEVVEALTTDRRYKYPSTNTATVFLLQEDVIKTWIAKHVQH